MSSWRGDIRQVEMGVKIFGNRCFEGSVKKVVGNGGDTYFWEHGWKGGS